jgi:protein-tyrosine-phosphatase
MPYCLIPTKIGIGDENVVMQYEFEFDESGIYNAEITKLMFNQVDIILCFSLEAILELESQAAKWMDNKLDHERTEALVGELHDPSYSWQK